jgi:hypothetical protein
MASNHRCDRRQGELSQALRTSPGKGARQWLIIRAH